MVARSPAGCWKGDESKVGLLPGLECGTSDAADIVTDKESYVAEKDKSCVAVLTSSSSNT